MLAGLTIYIEIRDFCQKNHFFNGLVNARNGFNPALQRLFLDATGFVLNTENKKDHI